MNNVKVEMVLKSGTVSSWLMPIDEATQMLKSISECRSVFYAVNHGSLPCWMVRVDEISFLSVLPA